MTAEQDAVFAVLTEGMRKVRVSVWLPNSAAVALWDRIDRAPHHPDVKFFAVRSRGDEIFGPADHVYEPEYAELPPILGPPDPSRPWPGDRGDFAPRQGGKSWRKLPPIRGYTRTPDEWAPELERVFDYQTETYVVRPRRYGSGIGSAKEVPQYRRMVRCDTCGTEIAALGVGYHGKNQKCQAMRREGR